MYMSLQEYLNNIDAHVTEGYSQQVSGQIEDLNDIIDYVCSKNINNKYINVMEIGFNAGHSAEIFLKSNDKILLTSFDIGTHDYLKNGKEYIDIRYPNRHKLILGDSTISIPNFINKNINNIPKFDIIFIDGGHEYEIAKSDLENCFYLAHKDTIVIIDDTIFTDKPYWMCSFNVGPTRAWSEFLEKDRIIEFNRKNYEPARGMSWGKYKFN